MPVLDTNVLIRYLTEDNIEQAQRAFALLQEVESGSRAVMLPEGVLVEAVQVLSSPRLYNVRREIIRNRLRAVLRLPGVHLPNKRTYLSAFDLYVDYSRLSFVDALCVAHAQREAGATVISFDQDFRSIPGLNWERP